MFDLVHTELWIGFAAVVGVLLAVVGGVLLAAIIASVSIKGTRSGAADRPPPPRPPAGPPAAA